MARRQIITVTLTLAYLWSPVCLLAPAAAEVSIAAHGAKLPVPDVQAVATAADARMVIGRQSNGRLVASVSRGDQVFGASMPVDGTTSNDSVSLVGTTHRFYVAWTHTSGTRSWLYVRSYRVGQGWEPRVRMFTEAASGSLVGELVARRNGRVAVSWTAGGLGDPIGYVAARLVDGRWHRTVVARLGRSGSLQAGVASSGRIFALASSPVYRRGVQVGSRLKILTRRAASSTWTPVRTLGSGQTYPAGSELAVNSAGAVAVAWLPATAVDAGAGMIRVWVRAATPHHRVVHKLLPYRTSGYGFSGLQALTLGRHLAAAVLWSDDVSASRIQLWSASLHRGHWSAPLLLDAASLPVDEETLGAEILTATAADDAGDVWTAATFATVGEDFQYFQTRLHQLGPAGRQLRSVDLIGAGAFVSERTVDVAVSRRGRATAVWCQPYESPDSYVARYNR